MKTTWALVAMICLSAFGCGGRKPEVTGLGYSPDGQYKIVMTVKSTNAFDSDFRNRMEVFSYKSTQDKWTLVLADEWPTDSLVEYNSFTWVSDVSGQTTGVMVYEPPKGTNTVGEVYKRYVFESTSRTNR